MNGNFDLALTAHSRVVTLNSKLTPAARLYMAKSYVALGNKEAARVVLESVIASQPPPGIAKAAADDMSELTGVPEHEKLALESYQSGDFAGAEKQLRALPLDSLTADDLLLLGMAMLKQRKPFLAERVFRRALKMPLDPEKRTMARELLVQARREESLPYWTFFESGVGWTSNAYDDGRSVSSVQSPLLRAAAGFGYHFLQGRKFSFKAGYLLTYEYPTAAYQLRTLVHTIQAPLIQRLGGFELVVTPFFQEQVWNGEVASDKTGVTARVSTMRERFELGGEGEIDSQHSRSSLYQYLRGTSYDLKPYVAFWGNVSYVQVYWLFGQDGTNDIVYPDQSVLPLRNSYQGPGIRLIVRLDDAASLQVGMVFLQKDYRNPELPFDKARNDREMDSFAKYRRRINRNLSGFGLLEFVSNSSSLGTGDVRDKNYDITTILAGLTVDVF
jgi:hypothetical protein